MLRNKNYWIRSNSVLLKFFSENKPETTRTSSPADMSWKLTTPKAILHYAPMLNLDSEDIETANAIRSFTILAHYVLNQYASSLHSVRYPVSGSRSPIGRRVTSNPNPNTYKKYSSNTQKSNLMRTK